MKSTKAFYPAFDSKPSDRKQRNDPSPSTSGIPSIYRIGWLRAAVLGANDGIISTASLIVGVAAAAAAPHDVLIAGIAGLVAGAMSMAAGEYATTNSEFPRLRRPSLFRLRLHRRPCFDRRGHALADGGYRARERVWFRSCPPVLGFPCAFGNGRSEGGWRAHPACNDTRDVLKSARPRHHRRNSRLFGTVV